MTKGLESKELQEKNSMEMASHNHSAETVKATHFSMKSKDIPHDAIFVGNLSYFCTEEILSSLFSQFGVVSSVSIQRSRKNMPLHYGFLDMAPSHAEAAINALNNMVFMGRQLRVSWRQGNTDLKPNLDRVAVHVSFLSFSTDFFINEEYLIRIFGATGGLEDSVVKHHRISTFSHKQSGYAFLYFQDEDSAERALTMYRSCNNVIEGVTYDCKRIIPEQKQEQTPSNQPVSESNKSMNAESGVTSAGQVSYPMNGLPTFPGHQHPYPPQFHHHLSNNSNNNTFQMYGNPHYGYYATAPGSAHFPNGQQMYPVPYFMQNNPATTPATTVPSTSPTNASVLARSNSSNLSTSSPTNSVHSATSHAPQNQQTQQQQQHQQQPQPYPPLRTSHMMLPPPLTGLENNKHGNDQYQYQNNNNYPHHVPHLTPCYVYYPSPTVAGSNNGPMVYYAPPAPYMAPHQQYHPGCRANNNVPAYSQQMNHVHSNGFTSHPVAH